MKFIRLKSFFKSREYRQMCFLYIKATIKYCVQKPFMYVRAIYDTIKLHIDYSNGWDRYLKIKEIENNNEKEKAKTAKAIAYTNFIIAIFWFEISLLVYCDYINRDDVIKESYETLYAEFHQAKENFKKSVNELEEMYVFIPYELKVIVEETKIDSFNDLNTYQIFSDEIQTIIDTINVTYD